MKTTGEIIRDKREKRLLLRHVSAQLDIHTAILSKKNEEKEKQTENKQSSWLIYLY